MTDFLLELRSEEIPARMQAKARDDLARLFAAELDKAGLKAGALETYATPRRLALIARALPLETAAVSEELKGPRSSAPPQALEGFLRKTGLAQNQLVDRDGVYFAVIDKPGRATAAVLAEAIPAIVRAFPWPKAMRWGDASASTESLRWVRPLQGIVALLGDEVVPFEIADIASGAATLGHRFHHPGAITIGSASDYVEKLRACHVVVDHDERAAIIRDAATKLAADAGLELIEDEGLVAENAGLTEWPVPLLGRFDAAFLDVPPEVIQLTARVNQKYFVCANPPRHGEGDREAVEGGQPQTQRLANAFVCTANIDAADGGAAIVEGNRKVLAARLSDAKFFYDTDLKVPLDEQAKKLGQIVFHEKLGTVADKVDRVAKLARWLVEEGIILPGTGRGTSEAGGGGVHQASPPDEAPLHPQPAAGGPPPRAGEDREALAALAERAARLCKADLVTGMVGEFPELQGLMGGYYAAAQGENPLVAEAIRDHYNTVAKSPINPIWVALSVADRVDTLNQFFSIDEKPTGSRDPFALRRAAIQVLFLTNFCDRQFDLLKIAREDVVRFIIDRWIVQNTQPDGRPEVLRAVTTGTANGQLYLTGARMRALQAFITTEDGVNLLAGYKRAANILRKEGWDAVPQLDRHPGLDPGSRLVTDGDEAGPRLGGRGDGATSQKQLSYTPEIEEAALIVALDSAAPAAADAVEREDFAGAMAALATLRAPIDAFFDKVTVNDPDPAKRTARLALLARVRGAVHGVADFSKIEG